MRRVKTRKFNRDEDLLIVKIGREGDVPTSKLFEEISGQIEKILEGNPSTLFVPNIMEFEIIQGYNKKRKKHD